jgi:hypothetical protein
MSGRVSSEFGVPRLAFGVSGSGLIRGATEVLRSVALRMRRCSKYGLADRTAEPGTRNAELRTHTHPRTRILTLPHQRSKIF